MSQLWSYFAGNAGQIGSWAVTTVWLAVVPLIVGIAVAIPLGWVAYRYRWVARPLVPAARVLYTIPSLVMFLILPGILGTKILDPTNVGVALALYTLALLVPAVVDGFASVSADLLAAAAAMGESGWQRFWSVHLPMSLPVLGAGIRVAAVSNVSLISIASLIGTAQLGQLFITGTNLSNLAPIVLGLIFFIALALILDGAIVTGTRMGTPWRRAHA
jgi:osmoprotectant transport system permease protein